MAPRARRVADPPAAPARGRRLRPRQPAAGPVLTRPPDGAHRGGGGRRRRRLPPLPRPPRRPPRLGHGAGVRGDLRHRGLGRPPPLDARPDLGTTSTPRRPIRPRFGPSLELGVDPGCRGAGSVPGSESAWAVAWPGGARGRPYTRRGDRLRGADRHVGRRTLDGGRGAGGPGLVRGRQPPDLAHGQDRRPGHRPGLHHHPGGPGDGSGCAVRGPVRAPRPPPGGRRLRAPGVPRRLDRCAGAALREHQAPPPGRGRVAGGVDRARAAAGRGPPGRGRHRHRHHRPLGPRPPQAHRGRAGDDDGRRPHGAVGHVVRVQARAAPGCRPGLRLPVPPQPPLDRGAPPRHRS